MHTFRVLYISNNLEDYPECESDTLEFPDLVDYVQDEAAGFIYCNETEEFWPEGEFFAMVHIKEFRSDSFKDF